MTQQEKEIMFLDLNDVLVKFWIEQGRPDKEVRIELLERMLNWQKKAGIVVLDEQSKEPVNEDLMEVAEEWAENEAYGKSDAEFEMAYKGFIAGAERQKSQMPTDEEMMCALRMEYEKGVFDTRQQMLKEAVEGVVCKDHIVTEKPFYFYQSRLIELPDNLKEGDKVKIIIVKED